MTPGSGPDEPGFDLRLETESSGLVANVTGRIDTLDALIAMFLRIAAELRRTGLRSILVIDHTHGVVPPEDQLRKLVGAMEGQGFATVRMAYVDARGTAISRMEVGEIIGREHGYECRVFDNEARARIWLHYGE
ncbi:hypothetical protein [Lysobacter hankyongensis]|uniref:Uncharacterized protein n=1 Tax=Lysobacter hankyongensis TaxID=1176535 RepID=A0ABP9C9M0_9GAMM